jgi:hypothetical protein
MQLSLVGSHANRETHRVRVQRMLPILARTSLSCRVTSLHKWRYYRQAVTSVVHVRSSVIFTAANHIPEGQNKRKKHKWIMSGGALVEFLFNKLNDDLLLQKILYRAAAVYAVSSCLWTKIRNYLICFMVCRNPLQYYDDSVHVKLPAISAVKHRQKKKIEPFVGPWPLFSFVNHTQSVGPLGGVISPSKGRYLHAEQHKHRINAHRYPCLKWDSNPRSQCLSGLRRFMHYTARLPWSASVRASEDSSCLRPRGHCDRLASERAKTVHALDRAATVIGKNRYRKYKYWNFVIILKYFDTCISKFILRT